MSDCFSNRVSHLIRLTRRAITEGYRKGLEKKMNCDKQVYVTGAKVRVCHLTQRALPVQPGPAAYARVAILVQTRHDPGPL